MSGPLLRPNVFNDLGSVASDVSSIQRALQKLEGIQMVAGSVGGDRITANTITAGQIAANTITAGQIAANTITAGQIAANTITAAQIAANTITATQVNVANLQAALITADYINALNITADFISTGVSPSARVEIDDTGIRAYSDATTKKLWFETATGNLTVTGAINTTAGSSISGVYFQDGTVTAAKLVTGTITAASAVIANAAIDTAQIANAAITNAKIGNLAVDSAKIADASITTAKIGDAQITTAKIVDAQITNAKIVDATIQNAKIGSLDAGKITTGTLDANRIATNSLDANRIVAGTVTATQIYSGSVDANKIQATQIYASDLAALTSTVGNLTGGTITGGVFQSAVSGSNPRTVMDSSGIRAYKADGSQSLTISASTGNIFLSGQVIAASGSDLGGQYVTGTLTTAVVPSTQLTGDIAAARLQAIQFGGGNKLTNSSADNGTVGYTNISGTFTVSTTKSKYGPNAFKIVASSTGASGIKRAITSTDLTPVASGQMITTSAWYNPDQVGKTGMLNVFYYKSDLTSSSITASDQITNQPIAQNAWTRISISTTVPSDAVYVGISPRLSNAAVNDVCYFDGLQIEEGQIVTAYAPMPDEILPGSITNSQIADLSATKLSGTLSDSQLAAISAAKITGQLTDSQILAVDSAKLTGSIVAARLAAIQFGGGNAITNSSFENQTMSEFALSTSGAVSATLTNSTVPRSGARAATITWTANGGAGTEMGISTTPYTAIKVSPGRWYAFSAWVRLTGTKDVLSQIVWLDSAGATISTTSNTDLAASFTTLVYGRTSGCIGQAPATAAYAQLYLRMVAPISTSVMRTDDWQFEEGQLVTAYAPKPNEILPNTVTDSMISTLAATKISGTITDAQIAAIDSAKLTGSIVAARLGSIQFGGANLQTNSSFENTTSYLTGYLASAATSSRETTIVHLGGASAKLVATGTAPYVHNINSRPLVTAGTSYIGSAWFYAPLAQTAKVIIHGYDSGGATLGNTFTQVAIPANTWTRVISPSYQMPAGSVTARLVAQFIGVTVGDIGYVDDIQIEEGQIATSYAPKPDEILPDVITGTEILDGSISTGELAANAVTAAKIAANTITAAQIATDTITASQIAANAITASELAAGAVVAGKITAGTIVAADIAALTITGAQISAGAITAGKIATDTITANEISANAITSSELAAGAVIAGKITAGTIVSADIAASTITGTNIAAGTITAANILANTITATQIAADTITADQIAANAITASELAAGAVVAGKITAGSIVTGDIAAATITGTNIAGGTITAANILSDTITANQIAADAITSSELNAGAVTAGKIAANAINSNTLMTNSLFADNAVVSRLFVDGSISTNQLAANSITATQIAAGSITAASISVGLPYSVSVRNGNFSEGNPVNGSAIGNGWAVSAGAATIQTDTYFGRVASITNATSINSSAVQYVNVPVGRHIIKAWIKTVNVVGGTGGGAVINVDLGTGAAGTVTDSVIISGTTDWTQVEAVADITTAGILNLYIQLGYSGTATGTAYFGNISINPSVGTTTITPGAITANRISVANLAAISADMGSLTAGTITGGTVRTSASGARVEINASGLDSYNSSGVSLFNLNGTTGFATFKTANTGARVELGSTGLKGYDSSGTVVTSIDNSTGLGAITGGTIQTAASGTRAIMDSTGLKMYNGATNIFNFDTSTGALSITGSITVQPGSVIPSENVVDSSGNANMLSNPNAANGITDWSPLNSTISSVTAASESITPISGTNVFKVVATTTGVAWITRNTATSRVNVVPGQSYTFAAYMRLAASAVTTPTSFRASIRWFDSTGTQIGGDNYGTTVPTLASDGWVRIYSIQIAPSNAVQASVLVNRVSGTIGDTYYVNSFDFRRASNAATDITGILPTGTIPSLDAGTKIVGGSITSAQIAANTIRTSELNVGIRNKLVDPDSLNALFNQGFEQGSTFWSGGTVNTSSASAYTGNKFMLITAPITTSTVAQQVDEAGSLIWQEVEAGDIVQFGGYARRVSGTANARFVIQAVDKDLLNPVLITSPNVTTNVWTKTEQTYTVASGIKYIRFFCEVDNTGNAITTARFDDVYLSVQIPGGGIVANSITASKMVTGTITAASGIIANAAIDTAQIADAAITNLKVSNVDATKITTGYLDANRINANTITTDKLTVGSFDNIVANPGFEAGNTEWLLVGSSTITSGGTTVPRSGFNYLSSTDIAATVAYSNYWGASEGEQYYVEAYRKRVGGTDAGTTTRIGLYFYDATKVLIGSTLAAAVNTTATYSQINVTATAPAGTAYARTRLYNTTIDGTSVAWDDVYARKMVVGTLLVDGAIDGKVITGATLQTSASATASRVVLNQSGISVYDTTSLRVSLPSSGGDPYFSGKIIASGGEEFIGLISGSSALASSKMKWTHPDPSIASEFASIYGAGAGYKGTTAGGTIYVTAQESASYKAVISGTSGTTNYWRLGALQSTTMANEISGGYGTLSNYAVNTASGGGTYLSYLPLGTPLITGGGYSTAYRSYDNTATGQGVTNAQNDYSIKTIASYSPTNITLECWFSLSDIPTTGNNFSLFGLFDPNDVMLLNVSSNAYLNFVRYNTVGAYGVASSSGSGYVLSTNTVYHAVGTFDNTLKEAKLYINGTLVNTVTNVNGWTGTIKPSTNIRVGADTTSCNTTVRIAETAIYNTVLTAAQITDHYTLGSTGQTSATVTVEKKILDSAGTSDFGNPAGSMMMYAGSTLPYGYLWCDGASYYKSPAVGTPAYPDLFASIGTTWGTTDSNHFSVPDMRSKFPIGAAASYPLGSTGGLATVTLTALQTGIPAHGHSLSGAVTAESSHTHAVGTLATASNGDHQHTSNLYTATTASNATTTGSGYRVTAMTFSAPNTSIAGAHTHTITGSTAAGSSHTHANTFAVTSHPGTAATAHENLPPYQSINYIIKT